MSQLPLIQTAFSHTMTLPDKVNLNYRPFVGREEKVLLLAVESDNTLDLAKAVLDVTNSCVEGYTFDDKPIYYTEFALVNIRAKSVGEDQDLRVSCEKCDELNDLTVNLEDVQFTDARTPEQMEIDATNGVTIKLKELSFQDVLNRPVLMNKGKETGLYYEMVDAVIQEVETPDNLVVFSNEERKDRNAFVDSLPSGVHEGLRNFINETPTTFIDVDFKCKKCYHQNKGRRLEGLENFFGS